MAGNPYRGLPKVSRVVEAVAPLANGQPASMVVAAVRAELASLRNAIAGGGECDMDLGTVATQVLGRLARESTPRLRPVINATGVILHTNLGRAPLHESAAWAAYEAARGYLNLELDLETGKRANRMDSVRDGIRRLTGAEDGTALNNCAAATVLTLRALAAGKEVIVSRGQLIEIGGGFRLPEVMATGGAALREVGTTNITRLADYEKEIGPNTGLLLWVHTSNYRVRGFTKMVPIGDLVALGKKHGIPVVQDSGSGAAVDLAGCGLPGEPLVSAGLEAGADAVIFSGDKLLGGPQAGIVAGSATVIRKIEADPLARAMRLDKMTLAALEATLRLYRHDPANEVPVLRMLSASTEELKARAERIAGVLADVPGLRSKVVKTQGYAGGGALPDSPLPAFAVALRPAAGTVSELARRLRKGDPAVVGRVKKGRLLLDLRTVFNWQEAALVAAVRAAATR